MHLSLKPKDLRVDLRQIGGQQCIIVYTASNKPDLDAKMLESIRATLTRRLRDEVVDVQIVSKRAEGVNVQLLLKVNSQMSSGQAHKLASITVPTLLRYELENIPSHQGKGAKPKTVKRPAIRHFKLAAS